MAWRNLHNTQTRGKRYLPVIKYRQQKEKRNHFRKIACFEPAIKSLITLIEAVIQYLDRSLQAMYSEQNSSILRLR